jgi:hypothetical protein
MNDRLEAELCPVMKALGLDLSAVLCDKQGVEYLPIACMTRAYISEGDWKKNTRAALLDLMRCVQDSLRKFDEVVDHA